MKKTATWVTIALGIAVILILVIDYVVDIERQERDARFAEELAKELKELEMTSGRLKLQDMTIFNWDKVCILTPYMRREDIERISTVPISFIQWWSFGLDVVSSPEGQWALLFFDEDGLVGVRKIWARIAHLDSKKLAKRCWLSSDEMTVRKTTSLRSGSIYFYFEFTGPGTRISGYGP